MCIPCSKTFNAVPWFLTLWPWPCRFTYFKKNCPRLWLLNQRGFLLLLFTYGCCRRAMLSSLTTLVTVILKNWAQSFAQCDSHNDINRAWVYLLYPLPTKLWGYTGFTMAVWLPSVEKWFLHNNSFSFRLTIKILHTCVDHDPRRTSSDFGVKGQSRIWTSNFLPFLHDNSISFWLTMMVLHMCWPWPKEDLYYVWSQKVKGQGQIDFKFFTVCITPFPCGIHCWYFTHVLTITWGRPLLIFGSKGKIWTSNFLQFPHGNWFSIWHTMMILHTCIPLTGTRPLIMLGWKSQGQILLWILHRFRMITPLPFDIQWWY